MNSFRSLSKTVVDDLVDVVVLTTNVLVHVVISAALVLVKIRLAGEAILVDETLAFSPSED